MIRRNCIERWSVAVLSNQTGTIRGFFARRLSTDAEICLQLFFGSGRYRKGRLVFLFIAQAIIGNTEKTLSGAEGNDGTTIFSLS